MLLKMPPCNDITKNSRAEWIDWHGVGWNENFSWWNERLGELPGSEAPDAPRLTGTRDGKRVTDGKGYITRGDIFQLGKMAHTSPNAALSTLWHAIAWGKGPGLFGVKPIMDSVREHPPGEALCEAANTTTTDCEVE